ncbi:MAG TPA: RNA polymerase subunit sigma, partial [Ktedonobacteraceae bacterium]|nr:RNA polymerase subunit sigma [Ktedonobacteraceae bacterium]
MAAKINKVSSSLDASVAVLVEKKRCSKVASKMAREDIFVEEQVTNGRDLSYEYEDECEEEGEDQRGAVDDSVKQYLKEIGMYP